MVYLNEVVPASNSWNWLNNTVTLSVDPYFDAGTANVQQNVASVTLTQAPATSMAGKFFSVDNNNEIYKIAQHTANSSTLKLEGLYNGSTSTAARFKIWTDKVVLPSDCMQVSEVITTNAIKPLDKVALQQFRKHEISGGALIGSPSFYCEGGLEEPSPYIAISGLPAVSTRASSGLTKTIGFAANVDTYISVGDRIHIESPNSYEYTGDFIVSAVSGNTITYTARVDKQESTTADTDLTVQSLNTSNTSPAPILLVYPAIQQRNQRINLVVDYQMFPSELIADRDEPLIPREHRSVLFFGAMWLSSDRETDLDRSDRYKVLMDAGIQKMLSKTTATPKTPTMRVSPSYLRTKSGMFGRARYSSDIMQEGFGGGNGSAGNAPTATGTPNSVAVFDSNGYLIGSSDIDLDLLSYLLGTQATGSQNVANDTTDVIDEWDVTEYKSAIVQYMIQRDTAYRAGQFIISTDGSNITYSDDGSMETGDTGADWTADLFGGNFRIKLTLDNQGTSGIVYYKVSLV
jgi:hypothetical protein